MVMQRGDESRAPQSHKLVWHSLGVVMHGPSRHGGMHKPPTQYFVPPASSLPHAVPLCGCGSHSSPLSQLLIRPE
jgi:hypothetical protein